MQARFKSLRDWPWHRWMQALCLGLFTLLFFHVAWPYGPTIHADRLTQKEWLPLEIFLWMDPLSGLAAAIAGRAWSVSLIGAVAVLVFCGFVPRAFCGYVCPLGTLHDLFEWLIGRHWRRWNIKDIGGWRHLRFYLLGLVLIGAVGGVMLAGYAAAIPVVTRGLMFSLGWLHTGLMQNWGSAGPFSLAMGVSLGLFVLVMLTGLLGRRFWCRYLCPTGALIGISGLFRANQRHVTTNCTECGLCVQACGFDAINEDISTRPADCAACMTCIHACPHDALYFSPKKPLAKLLKPVEQPATPPFSRRAWLGTVAAGAATVAAVQVGAVPRKLPLRPPGSVREGQFLDLCVRCGECFKVCPGAALQPAGLAAGFEALWTPVLAPTQAACHPDCNFCTQACPTGAIQPLALPEKRKFVIGIAHIDPAICLPLRGERECQLCFDECKAAGYDAIVMEEKKLDIGEVPPGVMDPAEVEAMAKIRVPVIKPKLCVGCGLCEYRCHATVHRQQRLITRRAIWVDPPPLAKR